jgi:hypothetical protein
VIDLFDAGGQVRQATDETPTPRSALERRVRRRRARRLARRGALTAVAVAVIATGTAVGVNVNHRPATQNVITTPGTVTQGGSPVTLPVIPHPPGSSPLDYGRLRLWLPADWNGEYSTSATCLAGPPLSKLVIYGTVCDRSQPGGTYVLVDTLTTPPPPSRTEMTVNGISVFASVPANTTAAATSWDVPSLGVSLSFRGAAGRAVAKTLGPSSLTAVLALHRPVAVPPSWKTVTVGQLTARVPADSIVGQPLPDVACGGPFSDHRHGTTPNVYLGDESLSSHCPPGPDASVKLDPAQGLWLQGADIEPVETGPHTLTAMFAIDGQPATVVSSPDEGPAIQVTLRAGGLAASAVIALGDNPVIAEEILSSLKPISVPKTPTGFVAVAGNGGIAGYIHRSALASGAVAPVYGPDLQTLVGHEYPTIGFVPLGSTPTDVTCTPLTIGDGGTTRTVPCPSHSEIVPDLLGSYLPTAAGDLSSHNLGVVIVYAHSATVPPGHIIAMSPAAGTSLPARSIETITSSLGPSTHSGT